MAELLAVVNDLQTLAPDQTTAQLLLEAARLGHRVWVAPAEGFGLVPGGVEVSARAVEVSGSTADLVAALRSTPDEVMDAAALDGVWVRTNPGRARGAGGALLQHLLQVEDAGVPVLNAPAGLLRAASKLYLGSLPASTVPRTWASASPARLRTYLDALGGRGVVKPALGTRGEGTERVSLEDADVDAALERATSSGPALLQEYIPEAPLGDVRVHVVGGELLEEGGAAAIVRRVPAEGEWRSNVALGGQPTPAVPDDGLRRIVELVGPTLVAHGLWHVGLDVVGDRIVECNVFSPGGLGDVERFTGRSFCAPLVERFVAAVAAR